MLSLSKIELRRGSKLLFEQASFQVHAGQRLGLVGANGCGKSSLFSLLLGEIDADTGELGMPPGAQIAHVAQSSPSGKQSALDFVQDGDQELREIQALLKQAELAPESDSGHGLYERLDAIDGFSAESRAGRLLHGLGFAPEEHDRAVEAFSGGWRMRLNLAQALMCRSDMLLLDEPTNHLDLPAILWLEQWLKKYRGILIVVSHDRDFLDGVCTRIAHIEHEHIRLYNGNYSEFENYRAEQLAQQQSLFKRQQKEIRHIQSYVDRYRYKASKARQAQSRLKMLERMTEIAPAHVDSPFRFSFDDPGRQPHHLVQIQEGAAGYGDTVILENIDLLISAGGRIGLLGVNGAGKSTLVKAISDGSTLLAGERNLSKDTHIGYFAQHQLDQLDPGLSPAAHLAAAEPGLREAELRRYLGGFGFMGERIFEPVEPFSGGEKARLVLALMIRRKPNLLLLDEPTNHLDLEMRQALSRALVDFSGAIVVISHDRHLLRSVCDDLLVVHDGQVERFNRSIDDYPAWLQEQQETAGQPEAGSPAADKRISAPNRKEQRQAEAEKRRRLKPYTDRVRVVEKEMDTTQTRLEELESILADNTLYTDAGRKEELAGLMREQAHLRSALEKQEADWLEASEVLDKASQSHDLSI